MRTTILIVLLAFLFGCNRGIEKNKILNDLEICFNNNQVIFDTLSEKFKAINLNSLEIQQIVKGVKLKSEKKYTNFFYTENITSDEKKTFITKELGYGINCGFFYTNKEIENYFENSRLVYKKINGNWYSFIFYN